MSGALASSMSYLRHFPIDTLKIDRIFVRDIASKSAGNAPLVDAIIAMAKSLGLSTVMRRRFKGSCSAARCPSTRWSAGTPTGCIRASSASRASPNRGSAAR